MDDEELAPDDGPRRRTADVDVLIVGAGITGIYQLYRAREAGFSALLLEAGEGVGGTWFWNRYPGARFDSESYTYAFLFSRELFDEWEWQEHFAAQPETERYLNHVVDRFDLRRDIRFGARVTSATYDESAGRWTVVTDDGGEHRTQFLIAATGVLSVPFFPHVPGRDEFRGESYHTALWPPEGVDLRGKRVAVIGTGSSGVQLVPVILDEVASLTVYQRSANWCTPLNNSPITPEQQVELRAGFEAMRETLNASPSGFLHAPHDRATFDDSKGERWAFYERLWNSPGFSKLTANYTDTLLDLAANAEWCEFIAEKIRSIVKDPDTADKLIPKGQHYGEKRPPYVIGYYEAFNDPKVTLVDLKQTPMVRMTGTGIETADGLREFDVVVWATGFDFGTGALLRMGIRGRDGVALADHWAEGARTFMGLQTSGFPNLFFPGGPHAAAGNNPRYNGDQVDFVTETLAYVRDHGFETIEVSREAEDEWTAMIDAAVGLTLFGGESSYFFGANVPGKPRKYLVNSGGRPKLHSTIRKVRANDYAAFHLSRAAIPATKGP